MTICHEPDDDFEYTDAQLVEHLQSSECSECVRAGYRMEALLDRTNVAVSIVNDMREAMNNGLFYGEVPDLRKRVTEWSKT